MIAWFGLVFEKGIVQFAVIHINGSEFGCDAGSILLFRRLFIFGGRNAVAEFGNSSRHEKVGQLKRGLFKAAFALQIFAFATPVSRNRYRSWHCLESNQKFGIRRSNIVRLDKIGAFHAAL